MRVHLTDDSALFVIGNCLKAAEYHAARGERRDFDFWAAKADEIADAYYECGETGPTQCQARR
jgi:hypothetical protein